MNNLELIQLLISILIILTLFQPTQQGNYDTKFKSREKIYCNMPCPDGKEHIICLRLAECEPLPGCTGVLITNHFRRLVVDTHNELRNFVALGNETRGGCSSASDMQALSYDYELEFIARCWANMCHKGNTACRISKRFDRVSQTSDALNLDQANTSSVNSTNASFSSPFISGNITNNLFPDNFPVVPEILPSIVDIIKKWYNGIEFSTSLTIDQYPKFLPQVLAFSNIIASKTVAVGCAQSVTSNDTLFTICNYGPERAIRNKRLFKRGPPASDCLKGQKPNNKFKGLCGEVAFYEFNGGEEKYWVTWNVFWTAVWIWICWSFR